MQSETRGVQIPEPVRKKNCPAQQFKIWFESPDWLGQSDPSMCWNHAESNQRHEACKVLAQSPEPVWRSGNVLVHLVLKYGAFLDNFD